MPRGGAREGAGNKRKYHDANGNELKTKKVWVPEILTDEDIQKAAIEKTKDNKSK
jgi:hypothetical protein